MNLMVRRNCVVWLGLLAMSGLAHAQEWTRFRGPNGTGLNADISIPAVWTDQSYRWKITLPAGGHSSPVLWGDKLFLTCADEETAQRMVLCLSSKDGATLWKRDVAAHTFHQHTDNSYASSTPAVDADGVYVAWVTPEEFSLQGYDLQGKPLWTTNLGPFLSQHGGGNSPIVVGDLVLIGDDQEGAASFLYGVDKKTGTVRWKLHRKSMKFSASTPVLLDPQASPLQAIFCSQTEGITSIDPTDGRVQWTLPNVFDSRTISSPVAGGGLVVATCGEGAGGHVLVAAHPPASPGAAPAIAFRIKDAAPYVPTPLIRGNLLFFLTDAGKLSCSELSTGKVLWQERLPGSYYSSPICAGDHLICTTKKGEVIVLNAGDKYKLLGKNDLGFGEKCHATPALADGCLFVRSYTHLACIAGQN